jgi:phosphoglycolate phosphatase-like HAD superfamily hydrolase
MTSRLVWLFDIDGTLITTDGAARESFAAAAKACWGIDDALHDIPFAGRTDPGIVTDIAVKHGVAVDDQALRRFWVVVLREMEERLRPGRGRVLPGVEALLDAIAVRPDWVRALLTGNSGEMARIKLGHFRLDQRFVFGAFGDEAQDRNALARVAVARAHESHGVPPERCIVVGDTELDVACARAAGARIVAVATGIRSFDELAALGPDRVVASLAPIEPILEWAATIAAQD